MAVVLKERTKDGLCRGRFMVVKGDRARGVKTQYREFTGVESVRKTLKLAIDKEHDALSSQGEAVRDVRPCAELIAEYLDLKANRGGRRGYPSSPTHVLNTRTYLSMVVEELGLRCMRDLQANLATELEAFFVRKRKAGWSTKTCSNCESAFRAWISFLRKHEKISADPLRSFESIKVVPKCPRRDLTEDQVRRIDAIMPERYRAMFRLAATTGLRAGEIRALRKGDLDVEARGVHLHAAYVKNRKGGLCPVPPVVLELLKDLVNSDQVATWYAEAGVRNPPHDALVFAPTAPHRIMDKYREEAGIPRTTDQGTVVFHSLRHTYGNMLNQMGHPAQLIADSMRHASISTTFGHYVHKDPAAVAAAQIEVAERLFPQGLRSVGGPGSTPRADENTPVPSVSEPEPDSQRGLSVDRAPEGVSAESTTPDNTTGYISGSMTKAVGVVPIGR